eukprot:COSAG04_NODE_24630_length_319_cov_0.700000_1_plen_66_part_10
MRPAQIWRRVCSENFRLRLSYHRDRRVVGLNLRIEGLVLRRVSEGDDTGHEDVRARGEGADHRQQL